MPPISQKKKDTIAEQILAHLFSLAPEPQFAKHISDSIARDDEFSKAILQELEKKKLLSNATDFDLIASRSCEIERVAFDFHLQIQRVGV